MSQEHRALIEPVGIGSRGTCPCGWEGRRHLLAELAIHAAEQHVRYEADRAALAEHPATGRGAGGAEAN